MVKGMELNLGKDKQFYVAKTKSVEGVGKGGKARNVGAVRASYFASGGKGLMGFYHMKIIRKVLRDGSYEEDCLSGGREAATFMQKDFVVKCPSQDHSTSECEALWSSGSSL